MAVRGAAVIALLAAAGCLPSALDEPQPGGMDPALVGTWLARGDRLEVFHLVNPAHGPETFKPAEGSGT